MTEPKYLLKKQDIEKAPEQNKIHFLNPNAQCTHRTLGDLTGLTGFGFHIMEVLPGHDSTEFHFHYKEDECVYILDYPAKGKRIFRTEGLPWKVANMSDLEDRPVIKKPLQN